jgi:hypothetical protein
MLQPWIWQFLSETVAFLLGMAMMDPEVPARSVGV